MKILVPVFRKPTTTYRGCRPTCRFFLLGVKLTRKAGCPARSIICHYANEYGDRESKKAGSSLRARSNSSAFIWANRERRSGGARQRERRGEKHGNIYAFRQGLFNDGLSQRPICT
jgi:hypothetical protein